MGKRLSTSIIRRTESSRPSTLRSFQPSIDEQRIRDLATLRFVENRENLIYLGPPRTGKTHIAVALAPEAIKHRYTVCFVTAHDLVEMLQQAYHNQTINRRCVYWPKTAHD
ncbi:ATP-binding protein [Paenibacillus sp. 32O-W]|uniref:ATP-binding protein n=1 Tax=Paenibacillus sp. 32O-W TaxID=1695218 RepID=UPI0009EBFCB7|nr:ATP-binding protein [Paenibacillus sp. 32O-W]